MSQLHGYSRSYNNDVPMSRTPSSVASALHDDHNDILSPSSMPASLPAEGHMPLHRRDSFDIPLFQDDMTPYVDRIAVALVLNDVYHGRLHEFGQLAAQLPNTIAARVAIYQQASQFQTQQLILENRTETKTMTKVLEEVQELLSSKSELTNKQKEEIKALARKLLIEPERTNFDIVQEMMNDLKKNKATNGFEAVFESPIRAKALKTHVGCEASYMRNQYRGHIRDYVFSGKDGKTKPCGITKATNRILAKFLPVAADRKDHLGQHMVRTLILRRFAREHKSLLKIEEMQDGEGSIHRGKGKKGRVADGEDFWSQATLFLDEKDEVWGRDLKSGGWSMYIAECIKVERELFPDDDLADLPLTMGSAAGGFSGAAAMPHSSSLLKEAFTFPPRAAGPMVLERSSAPSGAQFSPSLAAPPQLSGHTTTLSPSREPTSRSPGAYRMSSGFPAVTSAYQSNTYQEAGTQLLSHIGEGQSAGQGYGAYTGLHEPGGNVVDRREGTAYRIPPEHDRVVPGGGGDGTRA
ncbi:hypothetical protein OE88DRAFT_1739457 [Heliocybe sulcata]|uniref:Uncharacterized protein n=1 Tax=Heliocybe sulcata TaxID=5364 RepID=A0A5C3MLS3_9AGAM|nr:hypothetical protein OE88DRAFT_1739457 [Heliocybe sulcata]